MVGQTSVQLFLPGMCWWRDRIAATQLVPDGLDQLKLLFHAEVAHFFKKS